MKPRTASLAVRSLPSLSNRKIMDPRYFELPSGLARWLYRVVRKQAGDNANGWRWPIAELHERSGSTQPVRQFPVDLRKLAEADPLPEYHLTLYTDKTGGEALHAVRPSKLAVCVAGREPRIRRNRLHP